MMSSIGKPGRPTRSEREASLLFNKELSEQYATGNYTYKQLQALHGLDYTSISERINTHRKRTK